MGSTPGQGTHMPGACGPPKKKKGEKTSDHKRLTVRLTTPPSLRAVAGARWAWESGWQQPGCLWAPAGCCPQGPRWDEALGPTLPHPLLCSQTRPHARGPAQGTQWTATHPPAHTSAHTSPDSMALARTHGPTCRASPAAGPRQLPAQPHKGTRSRPQPGRAWAREVPSPTGAHPSLPGAAKPLPGVAFSCFMWVRHGS